MRRRAKVRKEPATCSQLPTVTPVADALTNLRSRLAQQTVPMHVASTVGRVDLEGMDHED
jgi:hypothetical protein